MSRWPNSLYVSIDAFHGRRAAWIYQTGTDPVLIARLTLEPPQ